MKDKNNLEFTFFGLHFRVDIKRYLTLALRVWLVMSLVLFISIFFFQYEMTYADIPGGFIFGFLLAYLIHILVDQDDHA